MRTISILLLMGLLSGCGQYAPPDTLDRGPRWHLDQPFYIATSPTLPKAQLILDGMRRAIGRAGGLTTVDQNAGQVISVLDTDGSYCQKKGVEAFAVLPATGVIYFCHSATVWSSYTIHDVDQIATHEMGHVLSNYGFHIGGDPGPGECPSRAVMSLNRMCRTTDDYTAEDRKYICDSGNVAGGICGTRSMFSPVSAGRGDA